MVYYSKKEYRLVRFEKSKTKNKKYNAILQKKGQVNEIRVGFGDKRYSNYGDKTGLNAYPRLIHGDSTRRRLYRLRHKKDVRDNFYSPGYFSMEILW
jgi:hypothetical protein